MENNKGNKSQKTCGIKDVLDIIGGKWAIIEGQIAIYGN